MIPYSYKNAGVDIERADQFVKEVASLASKTRRPEVLADVGPFAGLFRLPEGYKEPVLVAGTDGVGTKLKLAQQFRSYRGIGIDCVAMCVNDIACVGAQPLFFLDYLAAGKIDAKVLREIVVGMAEACQKVGCALLGGETAEMPGLYHDKDFDVAGFAVGVVERNEIIDGSQISPGDSVLGVASSGFHSNGFSLIRKILADHPVNLKMPCAETGLTLAQTLLIPTHLYSPLILTLKKAITLKGIAHITGGGLIENPPRILPKNVAIEWIPKSWPIPEYMEDFKRRAGLSDHEFLKVFNAGIGLILIVSPNDRTKVLELIQRQGFRAWWVGNLRR